MREIINQLCGTRYTLNWELDLGFSILFCVGGFVMDHKSCVELIVDAQKAVHLDTGGKGHHLKLASLVRQAETDEEASDILVKFESNRMAGVRKAQSPKLNEVKRRLRSFN